MYRLAAFHPDHFFAMQAQQAQQVEAEALASLGSLEFAASQKSFTGFYGDDPIVCAGLVDQWSNYAAAWALLSDRAGRHLLWVTRQIRLFLDSSPIRRVDTPVRCDFPQAERWCRMLGFQSEGIMKAYFPDGCDAIRFARVR